MLLTAALGSMRRCCSALASSKRPDTHRCSSSHTSLPRTLARAHTPPTAPEDAGDSEQPREKLIGQHIFTDLTLWPSAPPQLFAKLNANASLMSNNGAPWCLFNLLRLSSGVFRALARGWTLRVCDQLITHEVTGHLESRCPVTRQPRAWFHYWSPIQASMVGVSAHSLHRGPGVVVSADFARSLCFTDLTALMPSSVLSGSASSLFSTNK